MTGVTQEASLDESLAKAGTALKTSIVIDRAKPRKSSVVSESLISIVVAEADLPHHTYSRYK